MAQHMAVAGKSHTVNPGNHVLHAEHVCVCACECCYQHAYLDMRYGALHFLEAKSMYDVVFCIFQLVYVLFK